MVVTVETVARAHDAMVRLQERLEQCPDCSGDGCTEVVVESEYDDVPRRAYEVDGVWVMDCWTCEGTGVVPEEVFDAA